MPAVLGAVRGERASSSERVSRASRQSENRSVSVPTPHHGLQKEVGHGSRARALPKDRGNVSVGQARGNEVKAKAKQKPEQTTESVELRIDNDLMVTLAHASLLCKQPVDVIVNVILAIQIAKRS
jgi:hypothetical protein